MNIDSGPSGLAEGDCNMAQSLSDLQARHETEGFFGSAPAPVGVNAA